MSHANMPEDGDATMNLLIVLTKKVQKEICAAGFCAAGFELNQIEKELSDLACVKLFHYQKREETPCMVMPIANGEYALVLKHPASDNPKEKRDFFWCVGFEYRHVNFDEESKDRYCELPPDVKCRVILPRNIERYQGEAVVHAKIWKDVQSKMISKGHEGKDDEGKDPTSRLWGAYLKLWEKYIERMKIDICADSMGIKNSNTLSVLLSPQPKETNLEEEGEMIDVAIKKKEDVKILLPDGNSCVAVGTIRKRKGRNLEIRLGRDEIEKLKKRLLQLTEKEANYQFIEDNSGGDLEIKTEKEPFFRNEELLFTADVIKQKSGKKKGGSFGENCVILSSVELRKFCFQVDYSGDEYQTKVMEKAFKKVLRLPIWDVLSEKRVADLPEPDEALSVDSRLNEEQKAAVRGALAAPEIFLIWGPPGTGKTEVIQEIAKQEAIRGGKTLICSQANLAVDNALARFDGVANVFPFRVAKVGYKLEGGDAEKVVFEKNSPSHFLTLLKRRLTQRLEDKSANNYLCRDFLSAIEKSERAIGKNEKSDLELREFDQLAMLYKQRINIVGCTLMGAGKRWNLSKKTGINKFDTVIVDEVSKATPPELFVPIPCVKKGGRLILVGDHRQLPPMFPLLSQDDKSVEELAKESKIPVEALVLDETIFEKLWKKHSDDAVAARQMLRTQYRSPPKLQEVIEPFYQEDGQTIKCGLTSEDITNRSFANDVDDFFRIPAIWVDAYGKEERDGTSFYNNEEIKKVGKILAKVAAMKGGNLSVGVITFYAAQESKLRKRYEREFSFQDFGDKIPKKSRGTSENDKRFAKGKLIFGTVDRFQGRECDVVICSLVRNNEQGNIGFASKINRINVAFSRARRALVIVGSSKLFCFEARDGTEERKNALRAYKRIYKICRKG